MAATTTRNVTTDGLSHRAVAGALVPLIVIYAAIFAYAMQSTTYDVWGALWLGPALLAVSVPLLLKFARSESDPRVGRILVFALVFKLLMAVPRYYMVAVLYGTGDSFRYADTGKELRLAFLQGDFTLAALGTDRRTGTQFVEIVTGVVYTSIGPSFIGGFVFFSWLSFWGLFFFYRAFRVGIPDADAIRYAVLLFFLPSMLFWPSSIGKEAWMTLVLGMTTYGCALFLARKPGAAICFTAGLAGVLMVRPHMALLVVAGLALAYVLRAFGSERGVALGRIRTLIGLAAIGLVTMLVIRRVSQFFGIDEFNLDTATDTLEYAEDQTSTGDSAFVGGGPSLRNLPMNIVTVLFRPFVFEVDSLPTLVAALECTVLMLLLVLAWPRLRTIPRRLRTQPYIVYCTSYVILFCFMFSAFHNFGILARQRVLVFPLVLVLLALPLHKASVRPLARLHSRSRNIVPSVNEGSP